MERRIEALSGHCLRNVELMAGKKIYVLSQERIDHINNKLLDQYGGMVLFLPETYDRSSRKATFVDREFGEWTADISSVIGGKLFYKRMKWARKLCQIKTRFTDKEINERIKAKGNSHTTILPGTYRGRNKTAIFVDKDFGQFRAWPSTVLNGSSHRKRMQEVTKNTVIAKYGSLEAFYKLKGNKIKENYQTWKSDTVKKGSIQAKKQATSMRKYGVTHNMKSPVLRKNFEDSMVAKYGTKHALQVPSIRRKVVLKDRKTTILRHWKTGEKVLCQAGYEKACVEYFNKNKIDFEWQVEFSIPYDIPKVGGHKYFIDCYLPQTNIYIEIKGFLREPGLSKWNWFHKRYKNSELWDKPKLKELKILC